MSPKNLKDCPACRRPAPNRPLPPDGFWQVQVLQRIGMYPYRCESCGARFYRKVPIGKGLGEGRYQAIPHRPAPHGGSGVGTQPGAAPVRQSESRRGRGSSSGSRMRASNRPTSSREEIPKVVAPPEATSESLSHEDFVDLIDHLRRSEERKGLKVPEKPDEDG